MRIFQTVKYAGVVMRGPASLPLSRKLLTIENDGNNVGQIGVDTVQGFLGYTPANKAGDLFTGDISILNYGKLTTSTNSLKIQTGNGSGSWVDTISTNYNSGSPTVSFASSVSFGSNADAIIASSNLGYMKIGTNTDLEITSGSEIRIRNHWTNALLASIYGNGNFSLGNGFIFDTDTYPRIFAQSRIIYQSNNSSTQHVFRNQVGTFLSSGSVVEIGTGTAGVGSSVDLLRCTGTGSETLFSVSQFGGIKTASFNTYYIPALWVSDNNSTIGGSVYLEYRSGGINQKVKNISVNTNGLGFYRMTDGGSGFVSSIPDMCISHAGRVLVGTYSDDGTNQLQVNGNISSSGITIANGAVPGHILYCSNSNGLGIWQAPSGLSFASGNDWSQITNIPSVINSFVNLTNKSSGIIPYFNPSGTIDGTHISSFGRILIDDNSASEARNTLGLGSLSTISGINPSSFLGNTTGSFNNPSGITPKEARQLLRKNRHRLNYSATVNWDLDNGLYQDIVPSGTFTLGFPSNVVEGESAFIYVYNNSSGTGQVTFASGYKAPGGISGIQLTPSGNKVDRLEFFFHHNASCTVTISKDIF